MKPTIPWHEKPGVRVREGADILGIGTTKIYSLIKQGRLETIKIDECTLITVSSIKALLDAAPKGVGFSARERRTNVDPPSTI